MTYEKSIFFNAEIIIKRMIIPIADVNLRILLKTVIALTPDTFTDIFGKPF